MKCNYLKSLGIVVVVILVASISFSCQLGSTPNESVKAEDEDGEVVIEEVVIGVSMYTLQDPYFVQILNGVKEAAEEIGVTVMTDDPSGDTQKQVSAIENYIVSEVDGMIIAVVAPESLNDLIKGVMDSGTKIVAQNCFMDYYDCWITIIEYDYGFEAGKICGQWIKDNFPADEEVEVAIISANLYKMGIDRTKGLEEGILSIAPNAKIVSKQDGEGATDKAMNVAENVLQVNPNVKAIACFDDLAALGAYEAANAILSDEQKEKFYVGGTDAIPQALDAISEGGVYRGTVDIQPFETGKLALQTIVKLINGEEVKDQIIQPMAAVTYENIDQYVSK